VAVAKEVLGFRITVRTYEKLWERVAPLCSLPTMSWLLYVQAWDLDNTTIDSDLLWVD
jgi:hypothetical protein